MCSLWLRPTARPPGRPPAHQADRTELPISVPGDIALARERSPLTVWRHCTGAIVQVGVPGGRRQFIEADTKMPQALLLPQATVWQRISGLLLSWESNTPARWRPAYRRHALRL